MAEGEQQVPQVHEEEDDDDEPKNAYKPPAEKSIDEILKTDTEDESLKKYKETLLGKGSVIVFPENPHKVIMDKMSITVEGMPDKEIDLTDVKNLNGMKFVVKEGAKYRLKISFYVQREIVSGLKFCNKISRKIVSSKADHMAGSYGPSEKMHTYQTPEDEFPSGMLARGTYDVQSCFKDDDKNDILAWKWKFEIKKEWEKEKE